MGHEFFDLVRGWLSLIDWGALLKNIIVAALIFGGAFLLAQLLRGVFDRLRGRFKVGAPAIYVVEQLATYLILVVGFVAGVSALGVNLGSLTIFGGAVGVGLGLGLQGIVKEFVSGIVLIFDPAIQVGDFIELEGVRGEVAEIGARATRLRTNDALNVVIPNSEIIQSRVVNWTYNEVSRRIHVPFSVAAQADPGLVRDVVLAAARALPFTRHDESHQTQVWLTSFSGAGLDFDLVVWPTSESARHPRSMHAAYTWAVYNALRAAGLGTANPQMDVRIQSIPGADGQAADASDDRTAESGPVGHAPNDAMIAVFEEASRGRANREQDQKRERRN